MPAAAPRSAGAPQHGREHQGQRDVSEHAPRSGAAHAGGVLEGGVGVLQCRANREEDVGEETEGEDPRQSAEGVDVEGPLAEDVVEETDLRIGEVDPRHRGDVRRDDVGDGEERSERSFPRQVAAGHQPGNRRTDQKREDRRRRRQLKGLEERIVGKVAGDGLDPGVAVGSGLPHHQTEGQQAEHGDADERGPEQPPVARS